MLPILFHLLTCNTVYVGVYLHDMTNFDQKNGVFDVDIEYWAKWTGEFDHKKLGVSNAANVNVEFLEDERDGDWHAARYRLRGTLRGEFPLQRFPFDWQTISVVFALPESLGTFTADLAGSGMRERFSMTGWRYQPEFKPRSFRSTFASDLGSVKSEGKPSVVQQIAFEVKLERPIVPVLLKFFLPLFIIILVSLIALFMHPELVEARASIGITALLSCFAFQFTVADSMPAVAYITVADSLFILAYALAAGTLIMSIIGNAIFRTRGAAAAIRLDRVNQIVLPSIVAICVLSVAPLKGVEASRHTDPPASMWRVPSTRDTLRIGTEVLPSILASPLASNVFWPPPVESVPSVASPALRFLAGGELETTWRVREGAKWSDGAPVTAADLRFGFDLAPRRHLTELSIIDDAVVARYDDRLALALEPPPLYPRHVLEQAAVGKSDAKAKADAMLDALRTQPLPSIGPYRIAEFKAKEKLVAVHNEGFAGLQPSIRTIEVHAADRATLLTRFANGELDLLTPNTLTTADLAKVKPSHVVVRPSNILLVLQPDLSHPVLAVREVRRALLQAIDRERIVANVYGKPGRVAYPSRFDSTEAARTLTPHLPRLGTLALYHSNFPVETRIAQLVAEDLTHAGISVKLTPMDDVRPLFAKRDHQGLVLYALSGDRNQAPERFWNLPIENGRYARATRHDAFDASIADLCEREERALYSERREQLRDVLFAQFAERLPLLPLAYASERVAVDPALRGWETGTFGTGMERWYFE